MPALLGLSSLPLWTRDLVRSHDWLARHHNSVASSVSSTRGQRWPLCHDLPGLLGSGLLARISTRWSPWLRSSALGYELTVYSVAPNPVECNAAVGTADRRGNEEAFQCISCIVGQIGCHVPRYQFKPRDCQVLFCACFRCNQICVVPTACVSKRVYNRLQNSPQSMLITLSGTMIISCLVNIVQGGGGGGVFYLVFEYSKIRQKRSSVSSVLQPLVAPLPRWALDNGLSSSWSPNVQVGLALISRTSKPRFSVGGAPGLLQPSRLSTEKLSVLRGHTWYYA